MSSFDSSTWKAGNLRVWFQEKATEDTIIASWLCDLIREEGYEYALKSVDCVASEHSKHMDEKSFLSNQVQHTIGPRQTGDCLCKGSRVSFNIGPKPLPSPPALNVMSQGLL